MSLNSLQATLDMRARELRAAEGTIHTLKLELLAKDRQICELKERLFAREIAELETHAGDSQQAEARLAMRAQELELQDQIIAAAEQERATYQEYIEHLKAQLAELQLQLRQ